MTTSQIWGNIAMFAALTAVYMALTLAFPSWWSPVTNRLTDGGERVFFYGLGMFSYRHAAVKWAGKKAA